MKRYSNQMQKYLFLISLIVIGIVSGILFIFFVTKSDKQLLYNHIKNTFLSIKDNRVNYGSTLLSNLVKNYICLMFMYIASISIIGIPLILLFLFFKGFTFGFSISSIISIYNIKGILLSILYLVPSDLLLLIVWLLMGYYGINFSIRLFRYLFLKENISLNRYFKNLNKIFIISLIALTLASIIETFLSPFLIDLWF